MKVINYKYSIRKLYFGPLVLAMYCYFGEKRKIWTSFKTLVSKKTIWPVADTTFQRGQSKI